MRIDWSLALLAALATSFPAQAVQKDEELAALNDKETETVHYSGAPPGLSGLAHRGPTTDAAADIVFMDGQFVAWPKVADSR